MIRGPRRRRTRDAARHGLPARGSRVPPSKTAYAAASPAIADFERDFAVRRARARRTFALVTLAVLAAILLAANEAGFFRVTQITLTDGSRAERWVLLAGLPRLGEYVGKTIPTLRWASLGSDLAEWFWRWRVWAVLLVETVMIAMLAASNAIAPMSRELSELLCRHVTGTGVTRLDVRQDISRSDKVLDGSKAPR